MANDSRPFETSSTLMIASVSGRPTRNLVPVPPRDSTTTDPFSLAIPSRTTSSPTPRPERSETAFAVVSPARKMRSIARASSIAAASSRETSPFSTAASFTARGSIPRPSSSTSMYIMLPRW